MADLRLTKIDWVLRLDHPRLEDSDRCYFLREYTSKVGYTHKRRSIHSVRMQPEQVVRAE